MKKRIISMILALVMLFSVMPTSVFAAASDSDVSAKEGQVRINVRIWDHFGNTLDEKQTDIPVKGLKMDIYLYKYGLTHEQVIATRILMGQTAESDENGIIDHTFTPEQIKMIHENNYVIEFDPNLEDTAEFGAGNVNSFNWDWEKYGVAGLEGVRYIDPASCVNCYNSDGNVNHVTRLYPAALTDGFSCTVDCYVTPTRIVTFDANGGTYADTTDKYIVNLRPYNSDSTVNNDTTVSEPAAEQRPTKAGYEFKYWADAEGNKFDFSTPVTENLTLYAQWEPTIFSVIYKVDDVQVGDKEEYKVGDTVTVRDKFVKEGYTVSDWSKTGTFTMPAEDVEITATTRVNSYKVIYKVDDEIVYTDSFNYGENVTVRDKFVKEGYTVSDWSKTGTFTMPAEDVEITATTQVNSYKVIYKVDDEIVYTDSFNYGENVTVRDKFVKEGYTVSDWSKTGTFTMPAEDVEITATTQVNSYKVIYKVDDEIVYTDSFNYGENVTVRDKFVKEGYTVSDWSKTGTFTMPAEDVEIAATTQINSYTVTWIVDGAETVETYEFGAAISKPANPSKTGYTFNGWGANVPATMPAKNLTFTAQWNAHGYTVRFNSENGSGDTKTQSFTYGVEGYLESNSFTYADLVFAGWNTQADGNGTAYADGASVLNWTAENGAVIDLYAMWNDPTGGVRKITVTVTDIEGNPLANAPVQMMQNDLSANDMSAHKTLGEVVYTDENGKIVVTDGALSEVLRGRYVYCNIVGPAYDWALDPSTNLVRDAVAIINTSVITSTESTDPNEYLKVEVDKNYGFEGEFTLKVRKMIFNVTFDVNGGEELADELKTKEVTFSEAYGELPTTTRTGYTFDGWYLNDTKITAESIVETAEDHTLVAKWIPNKYIVTFDVNTGNELADELKTKEVTYDAAYGELPVPTKKGYDFKGWFLEDDEITAESIVKTAEDHTLVAKWEAKRLIVTFDVNGGDELADKYKTKVVVYDTAYGTLPLATRSGYAFLGWFLNNVEIESDSIVKTDKNHTLVAKWAKVITPTNPTTPTVPTEPEKDEVKVERLDGEDRYETAIEIGAEGWDKADTILIASGENYPDALAGVPLSKKLDAPILLVKKDSVSADVIAEIERLDASKIIILGGPNAVSENVANTLMRYAQVSRIWGQDRNGTAAQIAYKLGAKHETAFIVSNATFADALSSSSPAALMGAPILFANPNGTLPAETAAALKNIGCTKVFIVGGGAAVDLAVEKELKAMNISSERVYGNDRYLTSIAVYNKFEALFTSDDVSLATGKDFPDALTGAAFAAKKAMPVFLVANKASDALINTLKGMAKIDTIYVFGGVKAVPQSVVDSIVAALNK